MFKQIKTSKKNREVVAQLTRKLNLGKENIIARMALTHSLSTDRKLELKDIKDAGGKEYSKGVLLGDYEDIYIGLVCIHYGLYKTDKNIPKYLKLHIDDGLELMNKHITENPKLDGFDLLVDRITLGLTNL